MTYKTGRLARGKKIRPSSALLGSAALNLVPALLYWSVAGLKFDAHTVNSLSCTLFLCALAIWARWQPLLSVLIAIAGYAAYLGARLVGGMRIFPWTIVLYGAVVALLIIGLVSAVRRDHVEVDQSPAK